MNKLLVWFQETMKKTNRPDELTRFLLKLGVVLGLMGIILSLKTILWLGFSAIIVLYVRIFSKDKQRYYRENQLYLKYRNQVMGRINDFRNRLMNKQNRIKQRKTHRFYKCPECGQKVRVPKGKGKIAIKCPSCSHKFVKKS